MRVVAGLVCLALLAGCGGDDQSPRAPGDPPASDPGQDGSAGADRTAREAGPPASAAEPPEYRSGKAPGPSATPPGFGPRRDGDARRVSRAVAGFLSALRARDAEASCVFYTREVRALVGGTLGGDCPRGMEFAFVVIGGNEGAFQRVRVTSVELEGGGRRAVARVRLPPELRTLPMLALIAPGQRLRLEREKGRWRLALPRP